MGQPRIVTLTNLFPTAEFPGHGLFVYERMRRVVERTGFDWEVVRPIPNVPRWLCRGDNLRYRQCSEHEVHQGVSVHLSRYFHLPGLSVRQHARRIAKAATPVVERLSSRCPCVLDAHYVYPDGVAALMIGQELGIPTVVTARGTDVNVLGQQSVVRDQVRQWTASARSLLAVSEPLCRVFAEVAGVPADQVRLARNGVDQDRFCPGDRTAARVELGLPADAQIALGIGRLVETKGFHWLMDAARSIPQLHVALVGAGPERDRLAAMLPVERRTLLGALPPDSVATALQACDVMVLPTVREGWPNVVTEALATDRPVVASAVGGIPDILSGVEGARCGELTAVGDVAAIAAGIHRFLDTPPEPGVVSAFAQRYSWEEPIALLSELFAGIVDGVPARGSA